MTTEITQAIKEDINNLSVLDLIERLKNKLSAEPSSSSKILEHLKKRSVNPAITKEELDAIIVFLRTAAEEGSPLAQNTLAYYYEHGIQVEKNKKEAIRLYRLAAEQGNYEAHGALGYCYEKGIGVEQDQKEAIRLYRLAAEQGCVFAQSRLAMCYWRGNGVEKDKEEAMRLFHLGAELGDITSQYNLGGIYENGTGVEKDAKKAVYYYQLAATQGDATAQAGLGYCYEHGNGVETDVKEAVRLYKLAAVQNEARAQANLARFYADGIEVERDEKEAYRLLCLAAGQGNKNAQANLDLYFTRRRYIPPDKKEAVHFYRLAANQGCFPAQKNLSDLYMESIGLENDTDREQAAELWINILLSKHTEESFKVWTFLDNNKDQKLRDLTDAAFLKKIRPMVEGLMHPNKISAEKAKKNWEDLLGKLDSRTHFNLKTTLESYKEALLKTKDLLETLNLPKVLCSTILDYTDPPLSIPNQSTLGDDYKYWRHQFQQITEGFNLFGRTSPQTNTPRSRAFSLFGRSPEKPASTSSELAPTSRTPH